MVSFSAAATSLLPSADEATEVQAFAELLVASDQFAPELAEVYILPGLDTATSLTPSADEATEVHSFSGTEVELVQDAPAFVDV